MTSYRTTQIAKLGKRPPESGLFYLHVMRSAKEKALQAKFEELVISDSWGLKQCPPHRDCKFCEKYGDTGFLRQYRNFYVAGIPSDILPGMLDFGSEITGKDIEVHAFRAGWHTRKRRAGKLHVTKDIVATLALRRFSDTQKFASPNSADKSLQLLAQVAGIGKEVNVSGHVGVSWEQVVARGKDNDYDAVITIPDDDIVELPQLEDANA